MSELNIFLSGVAVGLGIYALIKFLVDWKK
jgi:hypothetical protein